MATSSVTVIRLDEPARSRATLRTVATLYITNKLGSRGKVYYRCG